MVCVKVVEVDWAHKDLLDSSASQYSQLILSFLVLWDVHVLSGSRVNYWLCQTWIFIHHILAHFVCKVTNLYWCTACAPIGFKILRVCKSEYRVVYCIILRLVKIAPEFRRGLKVLRSENLTNTRSLLVTAQLMLGDDKELVAYFGANKSSMSYWFIFRSGVFLVWVSRHRGLRGKIVFRHNFSLRIPPLFPGALYLDGKIRIWGSNLSEDLLLPFFIFWFRDFDKNFARIDGMLLEFLGQLGTALIEENDLGGVGSHRMIAFRQE